MVSHKGMMVNQILQHSLRLVLKLQPRTHQLQLTNVLSPPHTTRFDVFSLVFFFFFPSFSSVQQLSAESWRFESPDDLQNNPLVILHIWSIQYSGLYLAACLFLFDWTWTRTHIQSLLTVKSSFSNGCNEEKFLNFKKSSWCDKRNVSWQIHTIITCLSNACGTERRWLRGICSHWTKQFRIYQHSSLLFSSFLQGSKLKGFSAFAVGVTRSHKLWSDLWSGS